MNLFMALETYGSDHAYTQDALKQGRRCKSSNMQTKKRSFRKKNSHVTHFSASEEDFPSQQTVDRLNGGVEIFDRRVVTFK